MAILTPAQNPRGLASRIFMILHNSGGTDILPVARESISFRILAEDSQFCTPGVRARTAKSRSDAPASLPDGAASQGTQVRRFAISRFVLIIEPRRRS